ncbi:hypothetical protein [Agromyces sp. Soil535]|uniref:hypothetical protein n=1 Tax=Agromyces sp. Soil535 TaxID=1736390 RepID=UPI0006F55ADB|nr:hypothetical protein ASG80_16705 [Agromyces sp. Soil535]
MPSAISTAATVVLDARDWRAREEAHAERADALTAAHRARATRGERHPIEDFLFTYYPYSPSLLRRWHPGAGVELADAAGTPRADWRWYAPGATARGLIVDRAAMEREKAPMLATSELLLDAFELARDIRYLDMQASPYDMREWGGAPVRIETGEGKAEYVRRQRGFAERSNALRHRILDAWRGAGAVGEEGGTLAARHGTVVASTHG